MVPRARGRSTAGVFLIVAMFAIWLGSCSGGGSARAIPAPTTAQVVFTLVVPRPPASHARRPAYVSAATQSFGIVVSSGNASPAPQKNFPCTATACTANLTARIGTVTFGVTTYDAPGGRGNVLSSGTLTQAIVAGSNAVNVTLDGAVSAVALSVPASALTAGVPTSLPIAVTAQDADGYTIIGPGAYTVPIAIVNSDATGSSSVTPATIAAPGGGATFAYNGGHIGATVTLTPQVAGLAPANLHAASLAITPVGRPYQHIVVVIQENRSFDNLYGDPATKAQLPAIDTVTQGAAQTCSPPPASGATCAPVPLHPNGFESLYDPFHSHDALVIECHPVTPGPAVPPATPVPPATSCYMDGFSREGAGPTPAPANTDAYAYVPAGEIGPYIQFARSYGIADHFFSGALSPTYPGHQLLIAGISPADNPNGFPWDCTYGGQAPLFATGPFPDPSPTPVPMVQACFSYPTLATAIDGIAGASWHYYTGSTPQPNYWDGYVNAFASSRAIFFSTPAPFVGPSAVPTTLTEYQRNVVPRSQFFSDVMQTPAPGSNAPSLCTLPTISWITPDGGYSDHAGNDNGGSMDGPWWVTMIYNAIAQSPCYGTTAMIVLWDDSGGWYDHEPPPLAPNAAPAGYSGYRDRTLGMRVPLLFIAQNAVPQKVSHTTRDVGAILRFIENDIGAQPLGGEDVDFNGEALDDLYDNASIVTPIPQSLMMSTARKRYDVHYFVTKPEKAPDDD